ncbi:Inorganic pyrophosphatase 1 [Linum grandiflorum]
MAGMVVVFDFDKTIIDVDSDNWVIDELGFTDLFNQLLPTMPWNSLMDRMMKEIYEQGKTIDDIVAVLNRIPIHPRVVPAIKSAYALGCELRIVSDANLFFIETILEHLGLRSYFSEINTNPGFVDELGRVRISPHHDFTTSLHGCTLCPPNMCKGLVMERMQQAKEEGTQMIYLGDGAGDYCPSLKLTETDYVMPRKNFPVWDLISRNPMVIKAEIHEWSDGADLERVLLQIIAHHDLLATTNTTDCKFHTIAVVPAAPFPRHISVPQ